MSDKKKAAKFNIEKAKEYYSATEHSYNADSQRLSERGVRSNFKSQLKSTLGKSAKDKDLSETISSNQSSGSEFGGSGDSSKTLDEYENEKRGKKNNNGE